MSRVICILGLLLAFHAAQAQHFSGEIIYRMEVVPKDGSLSLKDLEDLLAKQHGTTSSYLITDGYYKSTYYKNNSPTYSYTYHHETKRMYDDYAGAAYITYRDAGKDNRTYTGIEVHRDSTIQVLGYTGYLVKTSSTYGTTSTYYSDALRINYEAFEGHAVGNWYTKLKEVNGALSLKSITEFDTHFEIREAIQITERRVAGREFALPKKPVAADHSALDYRVEMKQPSQAQIACYQQKLASAPDLEGRTQKRTVYVSFILSADGKMKFVKPYEQDEQGLYIIALDIVQNCGFQFTAGKIKGKKVDSQVYFPVEFLL